MPQDYILFGLKWFDLSQEEAAAAWNRLNIIDSEQVHSSYNIFKSSEISKSHDVSSSKNVLNSEGVISSTNISNSSSIATSHNIDTSSKVSDSEYVTNSKDITYSTHVNNSTSIFCSNNVINSLNIDSGIYVSLCKHCSRIIIGEALEDCNNCCMCFGLKGVQNYIFNKPSTPERIDRILTDLESIFRLNSTSNNNITSFFQNLPPQVVSYVCSLPEYQEVVGASFNVKVKSEDVLNA